MRYRTFGRTGWEVSEIGFGAWAIGGSWGPQSDADSVAALHRALDLGLNFIDTAQGYGDGKSERVIAEVLKSRGNNSSGGGSAGGSGGAGGAGGASGAGRRQVYVATKIPPRHPGAWPPSPYDVAEDRYPESYLRERLERSLRDLRTDVIDVVQLHTWTRAWNRNPTPLEHLRKFQKEGKLRAIGISTPEHDQNALVELMRGGWLDCVQVIYNIFEQEPQAEFFPAAREHNVGVIVRVAFDESVLTGKLTPQTKFAEGDFRNNYFAGDRLARAVARTEKIREVVGPAEPNLATAALKFALKPPAASTVIPGIRNVAQAEANCGVSDLTPMSDELERTLRDHRWNRAFWYGGK